VINISAKSSKGIVGERGQKHLLKCQLFPCASVVHFRFYISVRTHTKHTFKPKRGRRGRDRMVVGFTTNCANSAYYQVLSSDPVHGEVYSIQHYVIQFVLDFRQVEHFLYK
jgi:hypothetical protein